TSFVSLRQQREQAVTELVNTRFDWAHAFHELGRVLTTQTSITSLEGQVGTAATGTTPAPTPPPASSSSSSTAASSSSSSSSTAAAASPVSSATPAGSVPTFTVSGCATSQKAVAQMLQRLRLIDGVQ